MSLSSSDSDTPVRARRQRQRHVIISSPEPPLVSSPPASGHPSSPPLGPSPTVEPREEVNSNFVSTSSTAEPHDDGKSSDEEEEIDSATEQNNAPIVILEEFDKTVTRATMKKFLKQQDPQYTEHCLSYIRRRFSQLPAKIIDQAKLVVPYVKRKIAQGDGKEHRFAVAGAYLERIQGRGGFSPFLLEPIELNQNGLEWVVQPYDMVVAIGLAAMPRAVRREFVAAAESPDWRDVQLRGKGRKGARFAHDTGIYMRSATGDYESWLDLGDYFGMAEDMAVRNAAHDSAAPAEEGADGEGEVSEDGEGVDEGSDEDPSGEDPAAGKDDENEGHKAVNRSMAAALHRLPAKQWCVTAVASFGPSRIAEIPTAVLHGVEILFIGCSGVLRHPQRVQINLEDAKNFHFTKHSNAGKRWDESSQLRAYIRQAAVKLRKHVHDLAAKDPALRLPPLHFDEVHQTEFGEVWRNLIVDAGGKCFSDDRDVHSVVYVAFGNIDREKLDDSWRYEAVFEQRAKYPVSRMLFKEVKSTALYRPFDFLERGEESAETGETPTFTVTKPSGTTSVPGLEQFIDTMMENMGKMDSV